MLWSAATATTVANQLYPLTTGGEIVGFLMMVYAVCVFGYLASSLASVLVESALVPFAANEDFLARTPSTADRWLLVVPNAGHEFGNGCFPSAATVPCPSLLSQERLTSAIQSVGTQFLNRYVGGASSSLDDVSTPDYTLMHMPAGQPTQRMPTAVPLDTSPAPEATPSQADAIQLPAVSLDPNRYSAGYGSDAAYDIAVQQSFAQGKALVPGSYVDATISVSTLS